MIDYSNITVTHPLYNHFVNWAGLDINNEENYSMINHSLYATEDYIKNRFSINISPVNYREAHNSFEYTASFFYNPSNILSILKDNELLLQSINYFSTTEGKFVDYTGDYSISNGNVEFTESMLDTYINYVSGYVVKDIVEYEEDTSSSVTSAPKTPYVEVYEGNRLVSPYLISTTTTSITLKVFGEVGAKIIHNDTDSTIVIGVNGTANISIDTPKIFNTIKLALQDADGNTSKAKVFLIIKSDTIEKAKGILLSHDLVTSGDDINATIYLSNDAELELPDEVVTVSKERGVHRLTLNCPATEGEKYLKIGILNPDSTYSKPIIIPIKYDTTLDASYIEAINTERSITPYMPNDLLVAFFRLTDHFYRGTLFKNDNISRQSAGVSKSVSFSSHSIPKEILSVIHSYAKY